MSHSAPLANSPGSGRPRTSPRSPARAPQLRYTNATNLERDRHRQIAPAQKSLSHQRLAGLACGSLYSSVSSGGSVVAAQSAAERDVQLPQGKNLRQASASHANPIPPRARARLQRRLMTIRQYVFAFSNAGRPWCHSIVCRLGVRFTRRPRQGAAHWQLYAGVNSSVRKAVGLTGMQQSVPGRASNDSTRTPRNSPPPDLPVPRH